MGHSEDEPMGERVQALETGLEAHERACLERLRGINLSIDGITRKVDKQTWWLIGALVALVGWMAVQLYTLEPMRVQVTAAQPAAVSVQGSVAGKP